MKNPSLYPCLYDLPLVWAIYIVTIYIRVPPKRVGLATASVCNVYQCDCLSQGCNSENAMGWIGQCQAPQAYNTEMSLADTC